MKKITSILYSTSLHTYAIICIIIFSYLVRSFGRDWDGFTHMHPDERMLMMVTEKISIPEKIYPDFFNYGTLPIYLLRLLAQFVAGQSGNSFSATSYGPGLLSLGRFLSTIFDLGTIFAIYSIVRFIFGKKYKTMSLFAMLIYGMMFFTIQNSHFFVVDVFVTFFLTWATFFMLKYIKTKNTLFFVLQAIFIGFAVASKFTAVLFIPGSILTIFVTDILINKKTALAKKIVPITARLLLWSTISLGTFAISMPYALLPPSGLLAKFAKSESDQTIVFSEKALSETVNEFRLFFTKEEFPTIRFLRDMKEQTRMNSSPYFFPYTLQYAGTTAYIYYIKNIVLWGAGPFISILFFAAIVFFVKNNLVLSPYQNFKNKKSIIFFIPNLLQDLTHQCKKISQRISDMSVESKIVLVFYFFTFFVFFVVIGKSAVKFMRYMLPLYPMIAIVAAYGLKNIIELKVNKKNSKIYLASKMIFVIFAVCWAVAFLNIYLAKNTRATATDWILKNVPQNSVLGTEHWDDRVPIHSGEYYRYEEIPMYDRPDSDIKWSLMKQKFANIDYYIVASNRLYAPLQRLTDCKAHGDSCYPIASRFYADLLANKTEFKKVAEFTNYPHLGPIQIPDDEADESFTVYDHPKIMIFKK